MSSPVYRSVRSVVSSAPCLNLPSKRIYDNGLPSACSKQSSSVINGNFFLTMEP